MLLGGCAASFKPAPNPVEIDTREYARMMQAAADVLVNEGFVLDRQDYRLGVVSTKPVHSPTLVEPWRSDLTTGYQKLESTVNHQRRVVTVSLEAVERDPNVSLKAEPRAYMLRVEAMIEQEQSPQREMTGSTSGGLILGTLKSNPYEMQVRGIPGIYWQPVGRDSYLEQRLIAMIVRESVNVKPTSGAAPGRGRIDTTTAPPTDQLRGP